MIIDKRLVGKTGKYFNARNTCQFITVHETDNNGVGADAIAHSKLLHRGVFGASWHYTVDDKRVIQHFDDTVSCWHGGNYASNTTSIGIEICVNNDGDYKKAVHNAIELIKVLMKRHNISHNRVVQHNHWTGKHCPRRLREGSHGASWASLKKSIQGNVKPHVSNPSDDIDTLVRDTIRGKYGNGETRKRLLGSKYNEVQKRINKMYM